MHKTNSLAIFLALSLSVFHGFTRAGDRPTIAVVDSVKSVPKDSTLLVKDSLKVAADSAKSSAQPSTTRSVTVTVGAAVPGDSSATDSTKTRQTKKRNRIVRETTVNTIDELKGQYRSPKKALFMSLMVPGLGQAYVGHHWINYSRAAVYLMTDVALAYGWHHYVVDRQNQQIAKYRKFADENWRQARYESFLSSHLTGMDADKFAFVNPHRQSYCESVQNRESSKGISLYSGCISPITDETNYSSFKGVYNDDSWTTDSTSIRRSQFVDTHQFYELVGKEVEFITGWSDAGSIELVDSTFFIKGSDGKPLKDSEGKFLPVVTPLQQTYIGMRAKANDYARMQAYFLGGMVINHLVSALDAALTAHYHNKALYQTEVGWWDRLHLDGGLAWQGFVPVTAVTARVTF